MTSSSSRTWKPRTIHRVLGGIVFLFTLYLAVTGSVIQWVDLKALLSHAPGTDKELVQVREGINGPGNFVVIQPTDYDAAPLPAGFDYQAALTTVLHGARAAAGDAGFRYLDLRMAGNQPVGVLRTEKQQVKVDAATGAATVSPIPGPPPREQSVHQTFKWLHVLRGTTKWISALHAIVALSLFALTVTGIVLYFQLLGARRRAGMTSVFWSAGGAWRSTHRAVSVLAAVFLLIVSASGTMLAIDQLSLGVYQMTHTQAGKYRMFPPGAVADYSSPLPDAKLPAMLSTTLAAGRDMGASATPLKAVRLRFFNGIPQGILIAGVAGDTKQLVFNAESGKRMGLSDPGYPRTHYMFGWGEHEWMKKLHRGDLFGVPGRIMDLFAGLSLIYLSISGAVMYAMLWSRRRRGGKPALFWS